MRRENARVAGAAVALYAFAALAATSARAADANVCKCYVFNNFVGDDWRQQMLRSAQVAATKAPLSGRVTLTVNNVETTTQPQINSLNDIVREKPDAILIDPGSGDALNPALERARQAGIAVVSFDQVVTAECAHKVSLNFNTLGANQAVWMAKVLDSKRKVLMERGLAGAPVSEQIKNALADSSSGANTPGLTGWFRVAQWQLKDASSPWSTGPR